MSKEKSARTEPNSPTQLLELGLKLSGSGQAKEAEEAFRAAVAQKPDFAEAWCNLGLVLNKVGALTRLRKHTGQQSSINMAVLKRGVTWLICSTSRIV